MKKLFTILIIYFIFTNLGFAEKVYLFEDFHSVVIPSNWKNLDIDTNDLNPANMIKHNLNKGEGWAIRLFGKYGIDLCVASTSYFAQDGQADDWLITNAIELGENVFLTWDGASANASSGYYQSYQVLVSTTGQEIEDFKLIQEITNEYNLCHRKLDISAYSGEKIYLAFRNISQNVKDGYLYISNIKVFSPQLNDMTIKALHLPCMDTLGCSGIPIKASVENSGYNNVNSYEINYQANDGEIQTVIMDCYLSNAHSYIATLPVLWVPESAKSYKLRVWISKVNGIEDTIKEGNEISQNVYIGGNYYYKLPQYEEFTGSTCGPCATANRVFNPYLEKHKGNYTLIKYQMIGPAPGDSYFNEDGRLRLVYYYNNISGIPALIVNGRYNIYPSDTVGIAASPQEMGIIDINGTYNVYQEEGKYKIDVNADLTPYFTSDSSGQLVLYVAVVENQTTKNASTNGETEFHMVEQKMLPDGYGKTLSGLVENEKLKQSFTYTFDSTSNVEEYGDLSVVLFVQDKTTRFILGNAWATWIGVSVKNQVIDGNGFVSIFPNPASDKLIINSDKQIYNIKIFDILGCERQCQFSNSEGRSIVNIYGLNDGIYFILIQIDDRVLTRKFVVRK
ncbi:MAG: choice-of-anchor J domain-containing protein [bacterium]